MAKAKYDKFLGQLVEDYLLVGGETDPVAMAAIGDRQYTEENYISNSESITKSLDELDKQMKEASVVDYDNIDATLNSKDVVTATVDLSANGMGEVTLLADTAFTFTGFQLLKNYLLIIDPDGFTPSFAEAGKHIIMDGSADLNATDKVYISLTCIDSTLGSEKLLTIIMKEVA